MNLPLRERPDGGKGDNGDGSTHGHEDAQVEDGLRLAPAELVHHQRGAKPVKKRSVQGEKNGFFFFF